MFDRTSDNRTFGWLVWQYPKKGQGPQNGSQSQHGPSWNVANVGHGQCVEHTFEPPPKTSDTCPGISHGCQQLSSQPSKIGQSTLRALVECYWPVGYGTVGYWPVTYY